MPAPESYAIPGCGVAPECRGVDAESGWYAGDALAWVVPMFEAGLGADMPPPFPIILMLLIMPGCCGDQPGFKGELT